MAKWVDTKGWLSRYASNDRPVIEKKEMVAVEKKEEVNFGNTIIFIRPRCAVCRSLKLKCYGVKGGIRYYKCICGHKFKAIEK